MLSEETHIHVAGVECTTHTSWESEGSPKRVLLSLCLSLQPCTHYGLTESLSAAPKLQIHLDDQMDLLHTHTD